MATRHLAAIALLLATQACVTGMIEDDGTATDPVGGGGGGVMGGGGGGTGGGGTGGAPVAVDIQGPAVLPHVQTFANAVCGAIGSCTISTYNGHSPTASRALDILVTDAYGQVSSDNNALGNAVAEYALANQGANGITYVIWLQRYNPGTGWDPMEDRGSITQNHYDHVHVSFDESL